MTRLFHGRELSRKTSTLNPSDEPVAELSHITFVGSMTTQTDGEWRRALA